MKQLFAVICSHGAPRQASRFMEYQEEWEAHASFMTALQKEGFVLLGGTLERTDEVLLIIRATAAEEIVDPLSADPWSSRDILHVSRMTPWTLRLGSLS